MYQQERLNEIIKILKSTHYATVDYLVEQIHYSPASIRRDLTLLEKQGIVKRSYGGVEINDESYTPFKFRQHLMKSEKNKIAYAASKLIKNGDIVFLDGSTTVQYMGHYLTDKKDICIITNNMMLASYLKENGIRVYCTGGELTELPGTLSGIIAANGFASFHADIMFFSTDGVDESGVVTVKEDGNFLHNNAMLENSDKHVFLCGSDKVGKYSKLVQCNLSVIDCFITDKKVSDKLINAFPNTEFIYTEN
ncbi:MAG: DeoR/GlpR transcriptional regulator [Clostridia bacterium]|nr:DeoR/GlpR transcriptional regulator [Clostridia bacterium]